MDSLVVGPKQRKVVLYKNNFFYRNTIMVSEFKVLLFLSLVSNFWHVVVTG